MLGPRSAQLRKANPMVTFRFLKKPSFSLISRESHSHERTRNRRTIGHQARSRPTAKPEKRHPGAFSLRRVQAKGGACATEALHPGSFPAGSMQCAFANTETTAMQPAKLDESVA